MDKASFKQKVELTIEKYHMINKNEHIILGLSGGGDSMALFSILLDLRGELCLKITAVHVNHGIRGDEAKADEDFVAAYCADKGIDLKIYRFDIVDYAKKNGITSEEAGRIKRYEAFRETLKERGGDKIAVAHNLNDQAETVLMRIIRGTGQKGLGGIPPVRGHIIRPLIQRTRAEIEAYLSENAIDYRSDSTNQEQIYTRNKIRLGLIPYLRDEFNPVIINTLAKIAEMSSEENEYLEERAREAFERCSQGQNGNIDISVLNSYADVIKKRVIRLACLACLKSVKDISYEHIISVLELIGKGTGKKINLPRGLIVENSYGKLVFSISNDFPDYIYKLSCDNTEKHDIVYIKEISKYVTVSENELTQLNGLKKIYTKSFDYDKITGGLWVRNRRQGDKIYINHIGTQKLKKFFTDNKTPRRERLAAPLICDDNGVIWIAGKRESGKHEVTNGTKKIIVIQFWQADTE